MRTRLYEWRQRETNQVIEYIDLILDDDGGLSFETKLETNPGKVVEKISLESDEAAKLVKLWLRQWLRRKLKLR